MNHLFKEGEKKPKFGPGTQFRTGGKGVRNCVIVDILVTRNIKGELVKWRYQSAHEFLGQTIRDDDVVEVTVARGLVKAVPFEESAEPITTESLHEAHLVERAIEAKGVFKGATGLHGLLQAEGFWQQQPYSSRLYYGNGITDYLHRDVLAAAVRIVAETEHNQLVTAD